MPCVKCYFEVRRLSSNDAEAGCHDNVHRSEHPVDFDGHRVFGTQTATVVRDDHVNPLGGLMLR